MTDWSIYQLDDIVWDEFKESDDHIVPHPGGEHVDAGAAQGDCDKKLLHEVVNSVRNSPDSKSVAKDFIPEREEISFPTLNDGRGPMLEKGSWSRTPGVGNPDPCHADSTKKMTRLGSGDAKVSGNCFEMESLHNEFGEHDNTLGSNAASINGSMCQFSLDDISPTDSDLELFSNEHEDKESNFLSYYGWPDIGNFEDVDRMFRSCDSTFGQGNATTTDDELSWFSSSSRAINGSEDALKTGFKSSCSELSTLKYQEADLKFMPISPTPVVIDIDKKNAPNSYVAGLRTMDDSDSASLGYSYGNMLDTNAESKRASVSNEQGYEIDGRLHVRTSPITEIPNGSNGMVTLQGKQLKNQNQTKGTRKDCSSEYLNSGSFHDSGTSTTQQFTNLMERSSNPSLNATSMTPEEKIHSRPQMQATLTNDPQCKDLVGRAAFRDHLPVQKQLQQIQDGVGGHSDVGVRIELPAVEVDSSSVLEGSSMCSVLSDEISIEATGFRQLQYVMEQLDIRTKLCIRDSLYRLARSAEQRNNFGNSNNCIWDGRDKSGVLTTEESNKSAGFIDMETDTNPIDRAIAHLLFHRSPDPAEGALFTDSHTIGSSHPVMPGKSFCQEEVSPEADTKLSLAD
ncbi:hypothetical protein BVC80_9029g13 [Macleaya cordata]|uniref:Protein LNK1 n=1 Tax=Macleaya cordata TaxID=56857 RepID=A0A200QUN0_MACCD|nr:hypothetical protein BVC80_9029g13 [Macleaya cordata]